MKKSVSSHTLEENLDILDKSQELVNKATDNVIEPLLHKSISDDLQIELQTEELPLTPPETPGKIKSRSRLSQAFRSLRGPKSQKKNQASLAEKEILLTQEAPAQLIPNKLENIELEQLPDIEIKKKKSKLAQKFSLRNIRKYRVNPKKSDLPSEIDSNTQYKQIIEDRNIQQSQISLIDLPEENENKQEQKYTKKNVESSSEEEFEISEAFGVSHNINADDNRHPISNKNTNTFDNIKYSEPISPVKFEKIKKIQITIQGKKIERTNNLNQNLILPTTTTSFKKSDFEAAVTSKPTQQLQQPPLVGIQSTISNKKLLEQQSKSIKTSNIAPNSAIPQSNSNSIGKKSLLRKKSKTLQKNSQLQPDKPGQIVSSKLQKEEKIRVTESVLDSPPLERAPPRPSLASSSRVPILTSKGAIKKTFSNSSSSPKLKRQSSLEDSIDGNLFMRRENSSTSLERGRRFPRGSRSSENNLNDSNRNLSVSVPKEIKTTPILYSQSPTKGNNLLNPNLSGSIAIAVEPTEETSLENSGEQIVTILNQLPNSIAEIKDLSSFDSSNSQRSQSPPSESSSARRKISYVTQETISFSDKDREIDKREALSYLSGISEYSFESEISYDQEHMPAFGDLTMDQEEVPIMTTSTGEKHEYLYKILVIGELGTGKTSFIKRYVHQFFSQNYRATIGVDFALKVLHWDQNTIIRLQLWDIAGQERFGNMTRVYYKEAVGAFIVFDVTRSGTFDCVTKWKEDLDSKIQLPDGSPIPCILLANKCDQEKQGTITNSEKMNAFVQDNGFAGWFETSAKENINIDESARALVNKILLNDKLISASDILDNEKFQLPNDNESSKSGKKSNCSC